MTEDREQSNPLQSNLYNYSHKSNTEYFFPMVIKLFWVCMNMSKWKCASCLCSNNLCLGSASAPQCGCYLFGLEPRWDPWVLLGGTARVVVRDGVSLEVWYQFCHHLFQLSRHRAHGMLLSHTLAVHTDLPVETRTASGFILWDSSLIYNRS